MQNPDIFFLEVEEMKALGVFSAKWALFDSLCGCYRFNCWCLLKEKVTLQVKFEDG